MGTAIRGIFEDLPDNELLCFGLASDMVSEQLGRIGISDNNSMRMLALSSDWVPLPPPPPAHDAWYYIIR